ncbi:MAG: hypothetical protein HOA57_01945 [Candidatus Magasanikbacteria bacterium]|jgi:hypothetical protein|nr:hypothetical protein [Candidatus Magasanikbacteria bacterium]MBT4315241.1 hypothetical protein [Candidatus Magasanikbacteria bacterium]MBT4547113.1 hypothetical protein [Candidatus Magasanikbacteria bacterium]MBT6819117.1 hypothetical protein [Candidatus Magasanikbacteria bacterium]
MPKKNKETSERMVIKIPKTVADYFRVTFPHGKRSDFVTQCVLDYKNKREIEGMEEELRKAGKKRQK